MSKNKAKSASAPPAELRLAFVEELADRGVGVLDRRKAGEALIEAWRKHYAHSNASQDIPDLLAEVKRWKQAYEECADIARETLREQEDQS